jgi:DNA-binding NarL/FixJ family response regulator
MALLDQHEIEVVEMVYQGFKYPEIARQLGQYPHIPYKTMRKVKEKVRRHLRSSEEEN